MTKREIERLIFQIFLGTSPSYPQCFGNELFSVDQPDHDPPDVLCVSRAGRTLGVELREWLVQGQIAGGKKRERAEDSVRQALLPEPPNIYPHVGHIWLYPRESAPLPSSARGAFRSEILTLIAQIEQSWPKLEWWDQSGRFGVTNFADYGSFQTLPHHLHGLDVFWIGPGHRKREIHWADLPGIGRLKAPTGWLMPYVRASKRRSRSIPPNRQRVEWTSFTCSCTTIRRSSITRPFMGSHRPRKRRDCDYKAERFRSPKSTC